MTKTDWILASVWFGTSFQVVKWAYEFHAAKGVTAVENWVKRLEGYEVAQRTLERAQKAQVKSGGSEESEELRASLMDHLRQGSDGS